MYLSVFDLFKIGVGPSSSHTMGPMIAANRFLMELHEDAWPRPAGSKIDRLRAYVYGSLAFTGIGHATDRAVTLGLCGEVPATVDPDMMDAIVAKVAETHEVHPKAYQSYKFNPKTDLIFDKKNNLPCHTNGMAFEALDSDGRVLLRRVYYSIGGGFVATEEELTGKKQPSEQRDEAVPFDFRTATEMLEMAAKNNLSIAQMMRINEETRLSRRELDKKLDTIWDTMRKCIERGLAQEGELPGGLHIKRRAKLLNDRLERDWQNNMANPLLANDWLSVYALAVNEENAAGGRVVTAPTNGAAGVIPAVIRYYLRFYATANIEGVRNFLLAAAAIGGLIKRNASISGAEVGCQGEVGSASAMAAAGLTSALGGTPNQIENAAEIALEHHLGMTCDPIAGLVQVPCIERNALGSVKAVTASSLALHGTGQHFVPLDACIETMRQTGHDMNSRYKETSRGGLAVNVVDC